MLETQRFRIAVETLDVGAISHRQTSHYACPDRREETPVRAGVLRAADDRVVFDNARIPGGCWVVGPDTLYLRFAFGAAPE